jgi:hypothetical protein
MHHRRSIVFAVILKALITFEWLRPFRVSLYPLVESQHAVLRYIGVLAAATANATATLNVTPAFQDCVFCFQVLLTFVHARHLVVKPDRMLAGQRIVDIDLTLDESSNDDDTDVGSVVHVAHERRSCYR